MTYQIRHQTRPQSASRPPCANPVEMGDSLKTPALAQRKRSATQVTRREWRKPSSPSVRIRSVDLRNRSVDQREVPGCKSAGIESRKSLLKHGRNSTTTYSHHSGDHLTRLHGSTAAQPPLTAPAVGDTAEVNYTILPERQYLKENATSSVRNQQMRRPSGASRLSFRLKDRREISRVEADRLQAARLACLLATEAAVISARQRVLERREAKLAELRARMQLRHQQAEARRKALEQSTRERLLRLSQRQHRASIGHSPSANLHGPSIRSAAQFRSLRLPNRSANIHFDRRPIIAFGSSTPRTICFSVREHQAQAYHMNSNSAGPLATGLRRARSDVNSSSSASTKDSMRSHTSRSLTRFIQPTSQSIPQSHRIRDRNLRSPETETFSSSSQVHRTSRPSPRSLSEQWQKSNGNAVVCTMSKSCMDHIAASALPKVKSNSRGTVRSASNSVKRVNASRSADATRTVLSRNPPPKPSLPRMNRTSMTKSQDPDTSHRRTSNSAKSTTRKSDSARLAKRSSLRSFRTVTHSSTTSSGSSSKPIVSQMVDTGKPIVMCVDHRVHSPRRPLSKPRTDEQTGAEEAYRMRMQQQRRRAREQMNMSKPAGSEHAVARTRVSPDTKNEPMYNQVASEVVEDVLESSVQLVRPDGPQQAGDHAYDRPRAEQVDLPMSPVPDPAPTLPDEQPSPARTGFDTSLSESTLYASASAQLNREDTQEIDLTTTLRPNLLSRSLNFGTYPINTLLNGQEMAEREARRRRLEDIMARLRPPNRSDSRVVEVNSPVSPSPLPAGVSCEATPVLNRASAPRLSATSPIRMTERTHLFSRPQSSTSGYLTDPVFSNDSVVWPPVNDKTVQPEPPTDLIVNGQPQSPSTVVERAMSATPHFSPANSPDPKRANVVANLLASGRLNVRSRAATILLNMASGRSATEGLGTQNYSNVARSQELLATHPLFQKSLTPDLSNGVFHEAQTT